MGKCCISPAVIELQGDAILTYYALTREQAFTEWLGGTVEIRHDPDGLHAYMDGIRLNTEEIFL